MAANHTFEPDVLLIDADADLQRHYLPPEQVELAVEIVSPGTKRRDRIGKPADYELITDSAELLELPEPFPVKLRISEITP